MPASPITVAEQVEREGKAWDLVPGFVHGEVKVCRLDFVAEIRGGFMNVEEVPFPLCTVSEEHTFSDALRCRVTDDQLDPTARYRLRDDLDARERARAEEAQEREFRRQAMHRTRTTFIGGGGTIATLGERRERAAMKALRRLFGG